MKLQKKTTSLIALTLLLTASNKSLSVIRGATRKPTALRRLIAKLKSTFNRLLIKDEESFTAKNLTIRIRRKKIGGIHIQVFDQQGRKINAKTIKPRKKKSLDTLEIIRLGATKKRALRIQYKDKTIDLFDIKTARPINTYPIKIKPINIKKSIILKKRIFCVLYKNCKIDLFNLKNGRRINKKEIAKPDHKLTKSGEIKNGVLFLQYTCQQANLFNIKTGDRINNTPINIQSKRIIKILIKNGILSIIYEDYQEDDEVELFDMKTGRKLNNFPIQTLKYQDIISAFVYAQNSSICIVYKGNIIDIFDKNKRRLQGSIQADRNKKIVVAKLKTDNVLYVRYSNNQISFFDTKARTKARTKAFISSIQARQKQRIAKAEIINDYIYLQYVDERIDIHNYKTGKKLLTIRIAPDNIKQIEEKENIIYVTYQNNIIDLFDKNTKRKIFTTQVVSPTIKKIERIRDFTFATHQDNTIEMFDQITETKINTSHIQKVGSKIIVERKNKDILFFDTLTKKEKQFKARKYGLYTRYGFLKDMFFIEYRNYRTADHPRQDHYFFFYNMTTGETFKVNVQLSAVKTIDLINNKILLVQYKDKSTDIFDFKRNYTIKTMPPKGYMSIENITIIDNKILGVCYNSGKMDLFDLRSGKLYNKRQKMNVQKNYVKSGFMQNIFYTKNLNGTLDFFEANTGYTIMRGIRRPHLTKENTTIITNGNDFAIVSLDSCERLLEKSNIIATHFEKESNLFAIMHEDKTIELFDLDYGQIIKASADKKLSNIVAKIKDSLLSQIPSLQEEQAPYQTVEPSVPNQEIGIQTTPLTDSAPLKLELPVIIENHTKDTQDLHEDQIEDCASKKSYLNIAISAIAKKTAMLSQKNAPKSKVKNTPKPAFSDKRNKQEATNFYRRKKRISNGKRRAIMKEMQLRRY